MGLRDLFRNKRAAALAANDKGFAAWEAGRSEDAILEYNEAIRLYPTEPAFWVNRGEAFLCVSDFDSAKNDFTEAIRLNPELTQAFVGRGVAHADSSQPKAAVDDFNIVLGLRVHRRLSRGVSTDLQKLRPR